MPDVKQVLSLMRSAAEPGDVRERIAALKRFGIDPVKPLGLTTPQLRAIAKTIGRDQPLAEALWKTGIHDSRILASMVADPTRITVVTMDRWVNDFASWDVCDSCCYHLFDKTPRAWSQIRKWAPAQGEFVRRSAFATIAGIAIHDKAAADQVFLDALPLVEEYAFDDRNFVKKGVNWALRNIGKRNAVLRFAAIQCAERVRLQGTRSARWIAADAIRELRARG